MAVRLTGKLICKDEAERGLVLTHLAAHIRETLSEAGCLYVDVAASDDPLVFTVDEGFADRGAYRTHQTRTSASVWASATAGLTRDYELGEMRPQIAPETAADAAQIHLLTRAAFGQEDEAELIASLRADFDLPISLVAKMGRAYLGHIALSPMKAPFKALALAPLSVRAVMRRQGLGADLVRAGLMAAREKGYEGVFVVGEPEFYGRFGFSAEAAAGFKGAFAGPYLQFLDLTRKGLATSGAIDWAPAFDDLD